jgi:hypothetical protein
MSPILRVVSIIFIFAATWVAWAVLGAVMGSRTGSQSGSLRGEVAELWGKPQAQSAPGLAFHWDSYEEQVRNETKDGKTTTIRERVKVHHADSVLPASTRVRAQLGLDQRLKGLVWYSLYDVTFAGQWRYRHESPRDGWLEVVFPFPDAQGLYDDFHLVIDGKDRARELRPEAGKVSTQVWVTEGTEVTIGASYKSRGLDEWRYAPSDGVARLEDFDLELTTDFADIDYPSLTMSPSSRARVGTGWKLGWKFDRVITGHGIGMLMPARIQPGAMAAALSFSAPISLLFFFLVIYVLATLRRIDIHPVNYLFLAAAFFAFHLLFGYSVDHLHLVPAFILSSVTSIALVVSYLRLVVSARFAFVEAAVAQVVYLVGFSLAHFWEGYTGLTVTVLSIVTLFVLMQLTGRMRWTEVLAGRPAPEPRPARA